MKGSKWHRNKHQAYTFDKTGEVDRTFFLKMEKKI